MDKPNRTRWIVRTVLLIVSGAALSVVVLLMESRRPFVELESAGASIVQESDGRPRTISFCSPDANDGHLALMCQFPSVSSINLSRSSVTAAGVRRLQTLPDLHSLDLSETRQGDGIPEVLAQFPALQSLQLRHCPWVTDQALEQLSRLDSLESLMIVGAPITDRGLSTLSQFKNLERLGIDDCSAVTDDGLRALARGSRLESVSVTSCSGISDVGVRELSAIPSLCSLSAGEVPMRRSTLREILASRPNLDLAVNRFDFPELRPLINIGARMGLDANYEVRWVEIDDRVQDPNHVYPYSLAGWSGLDVATSESKTTPLEPSEDILTPILAVPNLTTLHVKSIPISHSGFRDIVQLKNLQQIILESVPIADDDLPMLAECRSLEVVWLRRVPITGEGVAALRDLPRLRELSLLSDRLSQAGLDAATSLHNLDTLAIGDVSLVSAAARIARMPNLSNLAMVRASLTVEEMQLLASAPHLQHLELLHSNLAEDALASLAAMPVLKSLYLAQCDYNRDALNRLRQQRPDLSVYGTTDLSRIPRGAFPGEQRRLLGGIPLLAPAAPTAVH